MRKVKFIFIFIFIVFILIFLFFFSKRNNVFFKNDIGVYEVSYDGNVFDLSYQNKVSSKIDALKSDKYTLESPLIIHNPYGIFSSSYYIYFNGEESLLEYTVKTDGFNDFTRTVNSGYTKIKEFQICGLVAGYENEVILKETYKDGSVNEKSFKITLPESASDIQIETSSDTELSSGLLAVLGHDKNYNSTIYLYDNDGVLRNEIILDSYRADRIVFDDGYMYFPYSKKGIAKVDSLGKIVNVYDLGNYSMHHDFILNDGKLLILASLDGSGTIEDRVIEVDLGNKEVNELLNMQDVLPEFYETAVNPGKNSYGNSSLDWIHLNSITVKDNDLILSSRELSTIICIGNYNSDYYVKYLLADEDMTESTSYSDLLYEKESSFTSQAGQHNVSYYGEGSEYYLIMFNNNYGSIPTRSFVSLDHFPNVGSYSSGDSSYFYAYKVNEETGTYDLVKSFALPYSSIVSSVQIYNGNIVTSSGKSNCFAEYDSDGNLLKEFKYNAKKYAYRVFKYSFDNFFGTEKTA